MKTCNGDVTEEVAFALKTSCSSHVTAKACVVVVRANVVMLEKIKVLSFIRIPQKLITHGINQKQVNALMLGLGRRLSELCLKLKQNVDGTITKLAPRFDVFEYRLG